MHTYLCDFRLSLSRTGYAYGPAQRAVRHYQVINIVSDSKATSENCKLQLASASYHRRS